jgi:predicted flap endonuclease-1-like 5' DNA nuclease
MAEAPVEEVLAAEPAAEKKPAVRNEAAPVAKEEAASAVAAPLFAAPEGEGDDLTQIKGIGPVAKGQLNEQGVMTFAQIAALSDEDIARIDAAMPFSAEQITDWRAQAGELAKA